VSDPFDVLRNEATRGGPVDVAAIKGRARRIERRRRVALSSAAGVIALVAIAGVLVKAGPLTRTHEVAQGTAATPESGESSSALGASVPVTSASAQFQTERRTPATTPARAPAAAAPKAANSDTAAMSAGASKGSSDALKVTISAGAGSQPHSESFTVSACNQQSSEVRRTFNSGQRYDVEVSRDTSLVWRWSDGMAFAQVVGEERWAPKECKKWTATWNGVDQNGKPAPSGSYQAVGVLTSSPQQRSSSVSFCLDLC
jgi:hypothetical protein